LAPSSYVRKYVNVVNSLRAFDQVGRGSKLVYVGSDVIVTPPNNL
jgi:hypothetical protein